MDYTALAAELRDDPQGLGYRDEGGALRLPGEILARLTATRGTVPQRMDVNALYSWALKKGRLPLLRAAAADPAHPKRLIAEAALEVFANAARVPELDLTDPDVLGLYQALVPEFLAPEEAAGLRAVLGSRPVCRAEQIGDGALPSLGDVYRAIELVTGEA